MTKKKNKNQKKFGKCKLTGDQGFFIESHIIPKGLMPKIIKQDPFVEPLGKGRFKRSRHGLYDCSMVTAKGEEFFSKLDSWVISTFRKNKLIWNSWGSKEKLETDDFELVNENLGFRKITSIDSNKLRVFFLSLLWRAATSTLSELSDIKLPKNDLKKISRIITLEESCPVDFYPIVMIQLHSRHIGDTHLCNPFKDKITYEIESKKVVEPPLYRFYFNGLIVHMYIDSNFKYTQEFGSLIVGSGSGINLLTNGYESCRELIFYEKSLEIGNS